MQCWLHRCTVLPGPPKSSLKGLTERLFRSELSIKMRRDGKTRASYPPLTKGRFGRPFWDRAFVIGALSNYTRSHFWKGDLKTTLHEDLKSNDPSMSKSHHGRRAMKTDLVEKHAGHCRTKGGLVAAPKYHVSKGWGRGKKSLAGRLLSMMWLRHKLRDTWGQKISYWAWSTRSNLRRCIQNGAGAAFFQPSRVSQNGSRVSKKPLLGKIWRLREMGHTTHTTSINATPQIKELSFEGHSAVIAIISFAWLANWLGG